MFYLVLLLLILFFVILFFYMMRDQTSNEVSLLKDKLFKAQETIRLMHRREEIRYEMLSELGIPAEKRWMTAFFEPTNFEIK